jgi:hypothetical protein
MDLNQLVEDLHSTRISHSRPRYRVWEPFMSKYHLDTICEVGVRDGGNFKELIKHGPKRAVAVDCWVDDKIIAHNDYLYTQEELDNQYETFKAEMADKPFVDIRRGYSFDVARDFPSEYFDFVYIDADHTYEGVKRDLHDWYPKVKTGGLFCGHDYVNKTKKLRAGYLRFGVAQAVDEFVRNNDIKTFFTAPNSVWGLVK